MRVAIVLSLILVGVLSISVGPTNYNNLQEALVAINGTGQIDIDIETLTGANNTQLNLFTASNITIVGVSPADSVIDCAQNGRFLSRASNVARLTLTLRNLAIINCNTTSTGGALAFTNTFIALTIDNVEFRNCNSTNQFGGAIAIDNSIVNNYTSTLTITNSLFRGNEARNGGAALFLIDTQYTISNTQFIESSVRANNALSGGAVRLASNGENQVLTGTWTNCTFRSNFASQRGGAIAFEALRQRVNISLSLFVNNSADEGGAIYVGQGNGPSVFDSVFQLNEASGSGGAVALDTGSSLTATRTTFENNTAGNNGGAVNNDDTAATTFNSVVCRYNTATYGGCVSANLAGAVVTISSSNITNNNAVSGGALYFKDIRATITDSTIANNVASQSGGGIFCGKSKLTMNNVQISNNGGGEFFCDTSITLTVCEVSGSNPYTDSCQQQEIPSQPLGNVTGIIIAIVIAVIAFFLCVFLVVFYYKDPKKRFKKFIWREIKEDQKVPNAVDDNKEGEKA